MIGAQCNSDTKPTFRSCWYNVWAIWNPILEILPGYLDWKGIDKDSHSGKFTVIGAAASALNANDGVGPDTCFRCALTSAKRWNLSVTMIWNIVIWLMLMSFFVKIVTATAKGYLKEQQELELTKKKLALKST
ncbi:hypothetical protein BHE74_00037636 [Ensete ventricosum]|nr:hypothetical protein BHE74_00037636 [Ensete ventricosum]